MRANRLIGEKSPYLLQHAYNPVDWMPWGAEAFQKARVEDKLIFLSVGYSTCHWCHVMERESFESLEIAELLNRHFVPIKVDREERPDVDRLYMTFVQATTGSGGWPMSVWLTPELTPVFGGTYFPPDSHYGRPGFKTVLETLAAAWQSDRNRLLGAGRDILDQLRRLTAVSCAAVDGASDAAASCFSASRRMFDTRFGGFDAAPKFPRPALLNFLVRYPHAEALAMVVSTLKAMARGGIHDHLGGGFHRYAVDERWFVPHFEKMLYDQAQLAVCYLEAYQRTADPEFREVARGIFEYVLREMSHPDGGFYSAEDADSAIDPAEPSKKSEGAYYVWTAQEIHALLGSPLAERFAEHFGVRDEGNVAQDPHGEFAGKNILAGDPISDDELQHAKRILLEARAKRPKPHRDDKILTSWNALMISAFARGAQALGEDRYWVAARQAAHFILNRMWNPETGVLLRRFRDGEAAIPGFLDDYAFLACALLDLYETGFESAHLEIAVRLAEHMAQRFEDADGGGFFTSVPGDPGLVLPMKDDYDGAEPAGNSMAALALARLAEITGQESFRASAQRTLAAFSARLAQSPFSLPQMLVAQQFLNTAPLHIVFAGDRKDPRMRELVQAAHSKFIPQRVLLWESEPFTKRPPLPPELDPVRRGPAAYVCRNLACQPPVSDPEALARMLE